CGGESRGGPPAVKALCRQVTDPAQLIRAVDAEWQREGARRGLERETIALAHQLLELGGAHGIGAIHGKLDRILGRFLDESTERKHVVGAGGDYSQWIDVEADHVLQHAFQAPTIRQALPLESVEQEVDRDHEEGSRSAS